MKVGEIVKIKPEWMDDGDEKYIFTAITEPDRYGFLKVRVDGGGFPSVMEVYIDQVMK